MAELKTLPERRAQETRRSIVGAAERVFGRKGYGEATVDDIISEAGISRGAFYHHFSNKKEVFRGLLTEHLEGELDWRKVVLPTSSLRELIQQVVGFQVEHLVSEHESGALSLEFWSFAGREEWAREAVVSFHRSVREQVATTLRRGQQEGRVRTDIDIRAAALIILALFEGIAVLKALDPDDVDVPGLAESWAEVIERFISARGDGAGA